MWFLGFRLDIVNGVLLLLFIYFYFIKDDDVYLFFRGRVYVVMCCLNFGIFFEEWKLFFVFLFDIEWFVLMVCVSGLCYIRFVFLF